MPSGPMTLTSKASGVCGHPELRDADPPGPRQAVPGLRAAFATAPRARAPASLQHTADRRTALAGSEVRASVPSERQVTWTRLCLAAPAQQWRLDSSNLLHREKATGPCGHTGQKVRSGQAVERRMGKEHGPSRRSPVSAGAGLLSAVHSWPYPGQVPPKAKGQAGEHRSEPNRTAVSDTRPFCLLCVHSRCSLRPSESPAGT